MTLPIDNVTTRAQAVRLLSGLYRASMRQGKMTDHVANVIACLENALAQEDWRDFNAHLSAARDEVRAEAGRLAV